MSTFLILVQFSKFKVLEQLEFSQESICDSRFYLLISIYIIQYTSKFLEICQVKGPLKSEIMSISNERMTSKMYKSSEKNFFFTASKLDMVNFLFSQIRLGFANLSYTLMRDFLCLENVLQKYYVWQHKLLII